ncbi:hypothetical protein B0H17DRAFT_1198080 [Mycena rosella]|uniref:F-box domain-containing protein n=1 Tax=Mycena rosella TaxID=1033263 RepID=A0AAD7DRF6_MYCRO|nr:hypothetical protein B0H17DRAFT_1198080 [Mycena rosella]
MHSALLLDDVLRQILALCPVGCLPAVASSCQAWRDPALDGIWCHIGSLVPLLNLIPGLLCVDGVYTIASEGPIDLSIFNSYAARVKHITQRHDTRVHPALLSILSAPGITILNMLTATRLSSTDPNCLPAVLSLSPRLRQLDLDCGFKNKGLADDGPSIYIEKLLRVASNIEAFRLRGSPNQRLNAGISQMSNLCSLTLRTGAFLTGETLVAISAFPRLAELHVEAGHLDIDTLTEAWPMSAPDVGCFRSLQNLRVCAQAPVLELLLKTIPPICTLRIEATTPSASEPTVCWSRIFDLIRVNASQTLEELTIEHHLEDIDLNDTITTPGTDTHTHTSTPSTQNNRITFDIIRLLAPLRHLRHLTIDTTRMPDLCDEEVEALATWWPGLEHLDLGALHSSECTPGPLASSPRATLACLRAFASSTPMLETLILPLSIAGVSALPSAAVSSASAKLSRATLSSPTPPPDPAALARYLHGFFPRLTDVEGTDRHEAEWGEVQLLLRGLHN